MSRNEAANWAEVDPATSLRSALRIDRDRHCDRFRRISWPFSIDRANRKGAKDSPIDCSPRSQGKQLSGRATSCDLRLYDQCRMILTHLDTKEGIPRRFPNALLVSHDRKLLSRRSQQGRKRSHQSATPGEIKWLRFAWNFVTSPPIEILIPVRKRDKKKSMSFFSLRVFCFFHLDSVSLPSDEGISSRRVFVHVAQVQAESVVWCQNAKGQTTPENLFVDRPPSPSRQISRKFALHRRGRTTPRKKSLDNRERSRYCCSTASGDTRRDGLWEVRRWLLKNFREIDHVDVGFPVPPRVFEYYTFARAHPHLQPILSCQGWAIFRVVVSWNVVFVKK